MYVLESQLDDEQGPLLGFGNMGTNVLGQSWQKLTVGVGVREKSLKASSGITQVVSTSGSHGYPVTLQVGQINLFAEQLRNSLRRGKRGGKCILCPPLKMKKARPDQAVTITDNCCKSL